MRVYIWGETPTHREIPASAKRSPAARAAARRRGFKLNRHRFAIEMTLPDELACVGGRQMCWGEYMALGLRAAGWVKGRSK